MTWQAVVEHTVVTMGYELVETERTPGGLLRVYIDRVAGDPRGEFIVVEDCEAVTRQLQHVLEVENCSYERLEVSSPGLDRPLKKAADYARFAGEQVALTLKMPFQGRKKYQGELQAADASWRIVYSDGKTQTELGFALEEVKEARLVPVLDFKGRRFARPEQEVTQEVTQEKMDQDKAQPSKKGSNVEVDGGRIQ